MSDPVYAALEDQIQGLQGVVVALLTTLINKDAIDKESLLLNLDVYAEMLAQNDDQKAMFEAVKNTLERKAWIPRLVETGKSHDLLSEDPQDDE